MDNGQKKKPREEEEYDNKEKDYKYEEDSEFANESSEE